MLYPKAQGGMGQGRRKQKIGRKWTIPFTAFLFYAVMFKSPTEEQKNKCKVTVCAIIIFAHSVYKKFGQCIPY